MTTPAKALYVAAAVVIILGGAIWAFAPTGHIRPYDADLQPLAETHLEAWCSGSILIEMRDGDPHPDETAACRHTNTKGHPDTPNLQVVVTAFCQGIVDGGWTSSREACIEIMEARNYWPTLHAQLTNAWNKAHPHPGGLFKARVSDDGDPGLDRGQNR